MLRSNSGGLETSGRRASSARKQYAGIHDFEPNLSMHVPVSNRSSFADLSKRASSAERRRSASVDPKQSNGKNPGYCRSRSFHAEYNGNGNGNALKPAANVSQPKGSSDTKGPRASGRADQAENAKPEENFRSRSVLKQKVSTVLNGKLAMSKSMDLERSKKDNVAVSMSHKTKCGPYSVPATARSINGDYLSYNVARISSPGDQMDTETAVSMLMARRATSRAPELEDKLVVSQHRAEFDNSKATTLSQSNSLDANTKAIRELCTAKAAIRSASLMQEEGPSPQQSPDSVLISRHSRKNSWDESPENTKARRSTGNRRGNSVSYFPDSSPSSPPISHSKHHRMPSSPNGFSPPPKVLRCFHSPTPKTVLAASQSCYSGSPSSYIDGNKSSKFTVGQQDDAQLLKILHNRWLQWRFVNARAEASTKRQKSAAERLLLNAWSSMSQLRASVGMQNIQLQRTRTYNKINSVLSYQGLLLEDWGRMEEDHSIALLGISEALKAAIARVPLASGARGRVRSIVEAVEHAVEVTNAMDFSLKKLLPKAEILNSFALDLVDMIASEEELLVESANLLARIHALLIEEQSLQIHFMQLEYEKSSELEKETVRTR